MTKIIVDILVANVGKIHDVRPDAHLRNIDVFLPCDVCLTKEDCKITANYFVSDFIVSFFKAAEKILDGSNFENISLSLSSEKNYLSSVCGGYDLHAWDSEGRKYKNINLSKKELYILLYLMKKKYLQYINNIYAMESNEEYQLFFIGNYSMLV